MCQFGRGRRQLVEFHQLHLLGEAHSRSQRLQTVEPDGVAERRKQTACEQLVSLGFVEPPSAKEETLEAVGVLFHGVGASALRQLEEGR